MYSRVSSPPRSLLIPPCESPSFILISSSFSDSFAGLLLCFLIRTLGVTSSRTEIKQTMFVFRHRCAYNVLAPSHRRKPLDRSFPGGALHHWRRCTLVIIR